jgi:hypothetical protein
MPAALAAWTGLLLGGAIVGAIVALHYEIGVAQPRLSCEATAGSVWNCRNVAFVGSDGKTSSLESCACADGGAP